MPEQDEAKRVLTVFGTRPEAIKLAPVVKALQARADIVHAVCVTAQHRHMLDQVLDTFELTPDFDLDLMTPGQDLAGLTAGALAALGPVIDRFRPDWIVVQGDTNTTLAAALAGYYRRVDVAHVEAGLRTGDLDSPWPEEGNRRLVGGLARVHFAPTGQCRDNLLNEGVDPGAVVVTGNTVIDALQWVSRELDHRPDLRRELDRRFDFLDPERRLILVTGHRRENFEGGLDQVCRAIERVAARPDVQVVFPVHLNPAVQATVRARLAGLDNVRLIEPQSYRPFVWLMRRAHLIVTDSGGIQEEAPSLGRPVLITRDTTERPEAVHAGAARLVGPCEAALVTAVDRLLDQPEAWNAMAKARNPFGDGRAAERIAARLAGAAVEGWVGEPRIAPEPVRLRAV
jgi:UDP-N-acetylglucosamine 2-epimerase